MARDQVRRKAQSQAAAIGAGVLVRDGAIVPDDPWIVLQDDEPAPAGAHVVKSLARIVSEGGEATPRNSGGLGMLVRPEDRIEDAAHELGRLSLIMVSFPAFRDGRGYTTARLLRERYSYRGELRAVGDVLEDQVFFMLRCGFDSFDLRAADPVAAYERARARFDFAYQPAADQMSPISVLRRRSLGAGETPQ